MAGIFVFLLRTIRTAAAPLRIPDEI